MKGSKFSVPLNPNLGKNVSKSSSGCAVPTSYASQARTVARATAKACHIRKRK